MKIPLPEKVSMILNNLTLHGYEAYIVGGCVRDSILGRTPEDWDITTSATPQEVKALFPRTVDTGIEHGTVTVMIGREGFEVTTYRIDGVYEDSRHPKEVTFTRSLEEDLKRRDFTINAMAYNEESRLVDPFGGMKDLNHHRLKCVGEPVERFSEDALRILRAIRFSAQLSLRIEPKTSDAMRQLAPKLANVSAERIQTELVKLLVSDNPQMIGEACELGITKVILPEWDDMVGVRQHSKHHVFDVDRHTLQALRNVRPARILRLTMLFHDMGKPAMKRTDSMGVDHFWDHELVSEEIARKVLRRLKFDNETVRQVTRLVCYHDYRVAATPKNVRHTINRIGVELFLLYLEVRMADVKAQSTYKRREKIENILDMRELYREIMASEECVTLRQLAVTGKDLMELGMEPGKEMGDMLNELLNKVLDVPEHNTKEYLCNYAKQKLGL